MIRKEDTLLSKKVDLFKATQNIINTKGISHLTLDNIAKEANISKGGLLYHFPTKKALIEGGIKDVLKNYAIEMDKLHNEDHDDGGFLRSYAEVSLNNPQQLTSGLLAAVATDAELLQPIQDHYENWQEKITNDGLDPVIATIIRLTIDGIWFCELFGLAPLEKEFKEEVLEKLLDMTESNTMTTDENQSK